MIEPESKTGEYPIYEDDEDECDENTCNDMHCELHGIAPNFQE